MNSESSVSHRVESTITGEGTSAGERILTNAIIGAVYTGWDLLESKLYRTVSGWMLNGKSKQLEEKLKEAVHERNEHIKASVPASKAQEKEMQRIADEMQIQIIRDTIRTREAVRSGLDFAEEELSDRVATIVGQKALDIVMGFNQGEVFEDTPKSMIDEYAEDKYKHTYVKAFAENISGYANAIMQVFFNDKWIGFLNEDGTPKKFMGVMLAEKSANFLNPGNTEAGLRIMSDIPLVRSIVRPIKYGMDHLLEHNAIAGFINVGFNKFLLGYHVMNTRIKATDQATAEIASKTA